MKKVKRAIFFLAAGKNCRGAIGILTSGTGDTKTLPKFPILCATHVYSREGTFWTACRIFFCFVVGGYVFLCRRHILQYLTNGTGPDRSDFLYAVAK